MPDVVGQAGRVDHVGVKFETAREFPTNLGNLK
jgi:hypothetical protein